MRDREGGYIIVCMGRSVDHNMEMIGDFFTKPLGGAKFRRFRRGVWGGFEAV